MPAHLLPLLLVLSGAGASSIAFTPRAAPGRIRAAAVSRHVGFLPPGRPAAVPRTSLSSVASDGWRFRNGGGDQIRNGRGRAAVWATEYREEMTDKRDLYLQLIKDIEELYNVGPIGARYIAEEYFGLSEPEIERAGGKKFVSSRSTEPAQRNDCQ